MPRFAVMISRIRIKNMVCSRCRRVVHDELADIGLRVVDVQLGEAVVAHSDELPMETIRSVLRRNGFDVVEDRASEIVELVKRHIIDLVQGDRILEMNLKLSEYLEQKIQLDYRHISTVFSQTVGTTIEKFFIAQRIERVKELLVYDEKSLTDIAFDMGYSSTAYLSNQFKHETGMTPTAFKKQAVTARKDLDRVVDS